ncbi:hypothetical protein F511_25897 [Dorcoceras hygrometricum]|uniref:Uncharacterized protein n=1 Tax=Dorcoceras hygrometricum TaxID=472368 RepID=A0A2Z7ASJ0_9LAMI|nr:hypothetical protein F511_25897 [Dorcoceras hygrometricum]
MVQTNEFDLVWRTPDLEVLEAAILYFMQALVWSGEAANRLTGAHNYIFMTRHSMDGVLNRNN